MGIDDIIDVNYRKYNRGAGERCAKGCEEMVVRRKVL
jgi:hypothetical protein